MIYKDRTDAGKLLAFHLKSNLGKVDPNSQNADQVFSLYTPMFFSAVGQFYKKFEQLTDEEVLDVFKSA